MGELLIGQSFGFLTVIDHGDEWLCRCKCGDTVALPGEDLRTGRRVQCHACALKAGMNRKHGYSKHPVYAAWAHMKDRCYNWKSSKYKYYGARGINVCDQWLADFETFLAWSIENGWRKGLTIDRIDNDKGYEPSNCRWVTISENNQNTRRSRARLVQ
jgi:hypothetical protein